MERGRYDRGKSEFLSQVAVSVLNAILVILVPVWALTFYFLLPPAWIAAGFPIYIALLFTRSYELFRTRLYDKASDTGFFGYIRERRVIRQNLVLGAAGGLSALIPGVIVRLAGSIGPLNLIFCFDGVILILITVTFFKRPGVGRTLSRSVLVEDRYSRLVADLASNLGLDKVELRVIPGHRSRRANASSWGLPAGRKYIFASSELFSILEIDEVGGIFVHELGHLKFAHSSKSYLYSSLLPLAWLNLLFIPFTGGIPYVDVISTASSVIVALLYYRFMAGRLSRRFERKADLFAARNYDREIYIDSLRKLTMANGGLDDEASISNRASHLPLNEREKLIRSA